MSTTLLRRTVVLSGLAIAALGSVAVAGLWHPNAPDPAMRIYLPAITLPTVVGAALIDGINPCAFTVLLLFITAMLATIKGGLPAPKQSLQMTRLRLLGMGSHGITHRAPSATAEYRQQLPCVCQLSSSQPGQPDLPGWDWRITNIHTIDPDSLHNERFQPEAEVSLGLAAS